MDFVIFATRQWDTFQRRPHYTALSKHARVLVVELPINFLTVFRDRKKILKLLCRKSSLCRRTDSLYIYTPFSFMPFGVAYRKDWLSVINSKSLAIRLQRVLKKLNFQNWIQVFFLPQQEGLQNILSPALRCFEVVDEYTTLSSPDTDLNGWCDQRLRALEQRILNQVDVVFTTSRALYESKKCYNPNTYYVPNAAEIDHFAKARDNNDVIPSDLAELPSPRIGFIGHLTDSLEVDLLRYLAKRRPEWSFVLIGENNMSGEFRNRIDFKGFVALPNIHWLGRRDYEVLPDYIRGFDICTMPYQLTDRLRYSHPNKIYQYLASGKPIVSTDFPAVREFVNVIEVAIDYDDFLKRVEKRLFDDTKDAMEQRITVALKNSLDIRARQKIEIFLKHFNRNSSYDKAKK